MTYHCWSKNFDHLRLGSVCQVYPLKSSISPSSNPPPAFHTVLYKVTNCSPYLLNRKLQFTTLSVECVHKYIYIYIFCTEDIRLSNCPTSGYTHGYLFYTLIYNEILHDYFVTHCSSFGHWELIFLVCLFDIPHHCGFCLFLSSSLLSDNSQCFRLILYIFFSSSRKN